MKYITDNEYQSKFSFYLNSRNDLDQETVVYSYNYTAHGIFELSKSRGYKMVLGQIDAGPYAGRLVRDLALEEFGDLYMPHDLYHEYEDQWHEECNLADRIIVNSDWSEECLLNEGIPASKIHIIPISFFPPLEAENYSRDIPNEFTSKRPLNVLFLGSLQLQKGIMPLIRAARKLMKYPVKFQLVGSLKMPVFIIEDLPSNMVWKNRVGYYEVQEFYKKADLFILPTYSDGFAVTQLEAQAWKLPIITTRFCGKIIDHCKNGIILEKVHENDIANAILSILDDPSGLKFYSENAIDVNQYSPKKIAQKYLELDNSL